MPSALALGCLEPGPSLVYKTSQGIQARQPIQIALVGPNVCWPNSPASSNRAFAGAMAKQARTRIYGNDAIDSMPELVQEPFRLH